jgi:hypothetical protein
VDLDPTDGLAAANLAQLQFRHGDYARARVNAEKASALDGYSSELMTRMGTLLFFMNDARGLPMVHRALAADPSPAPWFRMALFYDAVGRGDIQAASAEAARMSEFQGDGRIYVSAINAVAAALRRNGDAARKHWQAVVNRAPNAANDPISIFRRMGASVDYAKRSKAILEAAGAI